MKHKQEEIKHEMKRQQEIVNLLHELQEVSLERQGLEEKLDRGGYIPAEESNEQLALPSTSQAARIGRLHARDQTSSKCAFQKSG